MSSGDLIKDLRVFHQSLLLRLLVFKLSDNLSRSVCLALRMVFVTSFLYRRKLFISSKSFVYFAYSEDICIDVSFCEYYYQAKEDLMNASL